jgi:hypothetical protein
MDIANFIWMIPIPDGKKLCNPFKDQNYTQNTLYSIHELAEKFCESYDSQGIKSQLTKDGCYQHHQWENLVENEELWANLQASLKDKHANNFFWSSRLLLK